MSITSGSVLIEHLRRAAALSDAGQTVAQVAATLQAEGVPVPRQQVTHYAHYRHDNGELFPAEGTPGQWTAAKVTALLTCPEADPGDGYAAARSRLGSSSTTRLTVA